MKILERAKTPEGFDIQIEDWEEDYSFMNIHSIAAYPKAKNGSKYQWIKAGEEFRLGINRFKNNEEAKQAFDDLINGIKTIEDFSEQFYHGNKHRFYLGLINDYVEC